MQIFEVFFYLTILLLPTQLGLHFWPDFSLVLGRRVDYLSPTLYLTDITVILTLIMWFVQKPALKNFFHTLQKYKFYCLAVLLLITTNCVVSVNPLISVYKWMKAIEYFLLFYYIYAAKPSLKKTVYCFAAAIFYSSCIAVTQFFLQHTLGGIFWFLGERTFTANTAGIAKVNWCGISGAGCVERLRPYATFPHPNILGGFLGTTIPLLLYRLKSERNKYIRCALHITSIVGIITLGLTFSRSAWIIGGGFIIGTIVFSGKKSLMKIIGVTLGILLTLILTLPYISALNRGNESVFIRFDLAVAALQIIRQHVLFGTGLGTFLYTLPQVVNIRDLFFLQPVHNIYLLFFSETGLLGIVLLAGTAFLYKNLLKHPRPILLLPLLLVLLLGLVDHYPLTVQQGQLLTTLFLAFPFLKTNS